VKGPARADAANGRSPSDRRLEIGIEPELSAVADARRQVREFLDRGRVAQRVIDEVLLVVDEIVSNSIEHGSDYRNSSTRLALQLDHGQRGLRLRFADRDVPPERLRELLGRPSWNQDEPPPPMDFERGRGLFLIVTSLDECSIGPLDESTGRGLLFLGTKFTA
jgi:anti-sigma regulatory factor (Ser/Thr protein kinase)